MSIDHESNILDIFGDILEDDPVFTDNTSNKSDDNKSSEIESKENKKSKKNKKDKTLKKLVKSIDEYRVDIRLSAIDPDILNSTNLLSVSFDDLSLDLKHSWVEFLGFLIGAIHNKYGDEFIRLASNAGIFDNNITIRTKPIVHLDREFDEGLQVFRIGDTQYSIEVFNHSLSMHTAIVNSLKILGIPIKNVSITLEDPSKAPDEAIIPMIDAKITLSELRDTGEKPDVFDVYSVEISGETMECHDFRHGMLLILSYLLIVYEEHAMEVLKNTTMKDIVGVTKEYQDYFGIMKTTPLPNSDLYFYTNGTIRPFIYFVHDACESLGEICDYIIFNYRTTEKAGETNVR